LDREAAASIALEAPCTDRGVDLAVARPRVQPRRSGGDSWPGGLGDRSPCHLDGEERAPDPDRALSPRRTREGLGRASTARRGFAADGFGRSGRALGALPRLSRGEVLIGDLSWE